MTTPLDITPLLDPEIMQALAALNVRFDLLSHDTLPKIRAVRAGLPRPALSDLVSLTDYPVPARSGLSVRVYRPKDVTDALPCIYWMHGGGMVLGLTVGDDLRFDQWCRKLNCVAVSVDYALAPEFPYPAPLDDCYAGLQWVYDNAARLGVDTKRIGIAGASAGAGLAAGVALLARDRAQLPIAFQGLIYPMLDDRQVTLSSQWTDPVWPPQSNRFGWDCYLGALKRDAVPIYAAPARAIDLARLPPTFISVGALDGFSDEDIDYAVRLRHAGVPTELHVYPGAPHGFDAMTPHTATAKRARADIEAWLAKQISRIV